MYAGRELGIESWNSKGAPDLCAHGDEEGKEKL
jgi:hypothetical protein